jgi:hypothetical protein
LTSNNVSPFTGNSGVIDKAMVAFKKVWCKYDNCGEMPLSAIGKKMKQRIP